MADLVGPALELRGALDQLRGALDQFVRDTAHPRVEEGPDAYFVGVWHSVGGAIPACVSYGLSYDTSNVTLSDDEAELFIGKLDRFVRGTVGDILKAR